MPTDDAPTFRPGEPCWTDLMTSDPEKAKAFYGALFGWDIEGGDDEQYGGYFTFVKDGAGVGGGMPNPGGDGMPDVWSVYLMVDSASATTEAVGTAGGTVFMPPTEVGPLGSMAVVGDPSGAAIGMWQQGEHLGFSRLHEPGAASWFELHTRDYEAAVRFYEEAFGWNTFVAVDEPGFRYTTLGKDDEALAGIMDASAWLPEGVPSHWSVYWHVTDADAAVARAVELGASVVVPAEVTPYGTLATLADPTGAIFKLRQPPTG